MISSWLVRPRWADEAQAIGDALALLSAQRSFAAGHGGRYAAEPMALAGAADADASRIAPELARSIETHGSAQAGEFIERYGYRRWLVVPDPGQDFVFRLEPARPEIHGGRSFCVDASGRICSTDSGDWPPSDGVRCCECELVE